jgi:tetratricopeptide (TPR) repeat protein
MMVASLFFFPSRLTSTLFMAVLMLGLMEAVYLRRYALLGEFSMQRTSLCYLEILLIYCILIGVLLFGGYRPFKGELAYLRYMQASAHRDARRAEHHIREAISYDPYNSRYTLHAAKLYMDAIRDLPKANDFFEETVNHFNGDLTLWSVYYGKAAIKLRMGSLLEAREALKKALYYNPNFQPAREKLEEVEKVIQERGSVVIKFR